MVGYEFELNKIEVVDQSFCLIVFNCLKCDPVNNELVKVCRMNRMISLEF